MNIEPDDSVQQCVDNAGILMSNAVDNLELAKDPKRLGDQQTIFIIAAAHAQAQLAATLEMRARRMLDTENQAKAFKAPTEPPQPTVTVSKPEQHYFTAEQIKDFASIEGFSAIPPEPKPTETPERCHARAWEDLNVPRESQPRCVKGYEHKGEHVFGLIGPKAKPKPPTESYHWEPYHDESLGQWPLRIAGYLREIHEGEK